MVQQNIAEFGGDSKMSPFLVSLQWCFNNSLLTIPRRKAFPKAISIGGVVMCFDWQADK